MNNFQIIARFIIRAVLLDRLLETLKWTELSTFIFSDYSLEILGNLQYSHYACTKLIESGKTVNPYLVASFQKNEFLNKMLQFSKIKV